MKIPLYLAMTAAEFQNASVPPAHMAWMACHFSPYGRGISNAPSSLPENSMLILNDRIPCCGHDPAQIAQEMLELAQQFHCDSILLDFQREEAATIPIVEAVCKLPLRVGVAEHYAAEQPIVFVSAPSLLEAPEDRLAQWQGKEIWLEFAACKVCCSVTEQGASFSPATEDHTPLPYFDEKLYCRYRIELQNDTVQFILARELDGLEVFMPQAEALGVSKLIGLYQQFK